MDARFNEGEELVFFGLLSISNDKDDVTGTLARSISATRTFDGSGFFGIRLSIGSVVTRLVFSMTLGFTVAVGLLGGVVDDGVLSKGATFFTTVDFRSSKS